MNKTLLVSEEREATTATEDQVSSSIQKGVLLTLDVTSAPNANDTLQIEIEAKDPASGKYVPLTAYAVSKKGSEIQAGATLAFTLYPGAAETAALGGHEVMALALPSSWRAKVVHSAGGKWTYTLGAQALR